MTHRSWCPADFDLARNSPDDLRAGGPADSARIILDILAGRDGPARDIVVANAAAALFAAGAAESLLEGVAAAGDALRSGAAARVLTHLADAEGS